ncbi:MAG: hypothetical protein JXM69_15385 [Anaerolineae bacterium]|nr:hypothetical protein [Anaerolineae bacterium]
MSKTAKTFFVILFILVLVSLGLNGFLLWKLNQTEQQARTIARTVGPKVQEALKQTLTDLETFEDSTIEFNVAVDEEFPVQVDIPFKEKIDIPVQLTVPINQQIDTTILLDPLGTGQGFPVDVTVPVDIEIPIDTSIPVAIDRTIPISTSIPLHLNVPITVEIGDTELAGYIGRLREGLAAFDPLLEQLLTELK